MPDQWSAELAQGLAFTSQEEITSALGIKRAQREAAEDDRGAQEGSHDDTKEMKNTIVKTNAYLFRYQDQLKSFHVQMTTVSKWFPFTLELHKIGKKGLVLWNLKYSS